MKKIFKTLPLALIVMSIISCSSDENVGQGNNIPTQVVTFTCTQEQDANATRAKLNENATQILWQKDDKISIFDGSKNNQFTLNDECAGQKSGSFTGTCSESNLYVAVYPFTEGAELKEGKVEGIKLPATQKAFAGSFDPSASLMIATGTTKQLQFKNAVGWVKVTTDFECSKIELRAPGDLTYIAGKGTLSYNDGYPTIAFTSEQSRTITLVPKSEGGTIAAGTYYIVVPAVKLYAGWRITFTDASDSKEYIRRGNKEITFTRKTITDLGDFKTSETYWLDSERGIVKQDQEVDLGIKIQGTDSKQYRVIFAKSNLTATGLADNETDNGDYFAWGATEPWYSSISGNDFTWKDGYGSGYISINYRTYIKGKTIAENNVLKMEYDAARQILGGDWQIPTKDIWDKLLSQVTSREFDSENEGYKFTSNTQTLFLPAAGFVDDTSFKDVGSFCDYWSGTASSGTLVAYYLCFDSKGVSVRDKGSRYSGLSVRPVRLVDVPQ